MDHRTDLLTDELLDFKTKHRRDLLPLWVKISMWFYLLTSVLLPIIIIIGLNGGRWHTNTYGISSNKPLSAGGLFTIAIHVLKTIVSIGMFRTSSWAIRLAIFDAILGIIICSLIIGYSFVNGHHRGGSNTILPLELIFLIPYLIKMNRIKVEWQLRS
jgi:hypothetical protein